MLCAKGLWIVEYRRWVFFEQHVCLGVGEIGNEQLCAKVERLDAGFGGAISRLQSVYWQRIEPSVPMQATKVRASEPREHRHLCGRLAPSM